MRYEPDKPATTDRKPDLPFFMPWIARLMMGVSGWKIAGHVPDIPQALAVGYSHTSNWDGLLMMMVSWYLRVRINWMVKIEALQKPYGFILKWFGAVGIDRQRSLNTVDQIVEMFRDNPRFVMSIAPEGTRRKTHYWKTGFYHISQQANVPMIPIGFDYGRKTMVIGPLFYPTGDLVQDIEEFKEFYADVRARHPEKQGDILLRPAYEKHDEHRHADEEEHSVEQA